MRLVVVASLLALVSSIALGQGLGGALEMTAPLFGTNSLVVTKLNPDGTAQLEFAPNVARSARSMLGSSFIEGYYLLVATPPNNPASGKVFRVEVIDIADGWVITVKLGPRAADRLQVNDACGLLRPANSTTARLKALPDEIPFVAPAPEPNAPDPRETAAQLESVRNLKRIGLALHNYMSTFGRFPPASIVDPDGKPRHSWRVLILPYLEANDLFNAYNFDEPWDSPGNRKLIDKMPSVYRDPIYSSPGKGITHYAAITGPDALFNSTPPIQRGRLELNSAGTTIRDIFDGTSNTIMVTSVDNERAIPWTKPEDIEVGPGFKGFGVAGGIAAPYRFKSDPMIRSAPFLYADGSVRLIGTSLKKPTLDALISIKGGEIVPPNAVPSDAIGAPASRMKFLRIKQDDGKPTAVVE